MPSIIGFRVNVDSSGKLKDPFMLSDLKRHKSKNDLGVGIKLPDGKDQVLYISRAKLRGVQNIILEIFDERRMKV